ncbi:hypothetical protein J113_14135 [Mycobacterium tuberculosis CAS/NITR204]|uniref:Amidohydrolase 3 domain-containing protein n=1 Tax=Mycobacterium tuberculosis CAS/NITR204 TaxID=1310114 RepID=R4MJ72_MYCTX|nr:hypothetical protein J113_14135 [Mycobacterium tuberculosis CAS/NITR204]
MSQIPVKLLVNGRVYSPTHPEATAMAVRGDVVAWLGSDDVGRDQFPDADVQDLDGRFVAPGFVDSHIHLTATGLMLSWLDLRPATSRAQCLRMVADYAADHPGQPLWGHGWDESAWPENAAPSTADLTGLSTRLPGLRAGIRVGLLRTAAAGPRAGGGNRLHGPAAADRDAHHLARAAARYPCPTSSLPTPGPWRCGNAAGVVAVHECAGPEIGGLDDWLRLRALEHGVEVIGYWGEAVATPAQARDLVTETGARGLAGDLFVDGALGSRTAWLHEPYADAPDCIGTCHLDVDGIEAHVRACTKAEVTAGFHVIGDAAVSAAVAAFERVVADLGVVAVARCGHRRHVEMVTADQAAKLGVWGVIASVQPNFDELWGGGDGMTLAAWAPSEAANSTRWRCSSSQGVPLALGSDAPVTGFDPWASVRAAVHHRTPEELGVLARAAFAAATRGGWRAGGVRDGRIGTLVPGAPASYAIWDAGDFDVDAPRDAVQRWSTDPRSRVPALPRLGPTDALPRCRQTVHRGAVIYG